MSAQSRRRVQVRLRRALIAELSAMNLPDDGVHLGRVARALVMETVELLVGSGIPSPAIVGLVMQATAKALKNRSNVTGDLGQSIPAAKA